MRTVFFDVDTQYDFVLPAGALYVPGAEQILPAVARLNQYAASHSIPLISTADAHSQNDTEFKTWPPHCVAGTLGARKPVETEVGQFVLYKQSTDCFTVPELSLRLSELPADRYVVYGVVTEICVRHAAFGLLKTGKRVEIVEDAVKELSADARNLMLAEFASAGGALTTTERLLLG